MQKNKILKIIIIILDIIAFPLLLIQAIGGNINISGIGVLLISNVIIFTSKSKENGDNNNEKK